MTFSCGCSDDARFRCAEHAHWFCHAPALEGRFDFDGAVCPPCRIAKWRSVSLSSAATPTRNRE